MTYCRAFDSAFQLQNKRALHYFVLALVLGLQSCASGAVIRYTFHVARNNQSVACVSKSIYTVNGKYPGPTIEAADGDTVIVTVKNKLKHENTAIHFHGIQQRGTPFYDGAPSASMCPIPAGHRLTYKFTIEGQIGTFWWHSHLKLQRTNGLYGLMVVHPRAGAPQEASLLGYDEELEPMLLNDWWNLDPTIAFKDHFAAPITDPMTFNDLLEDPATLVINGRGVQNCSNTDVLHGRPCSHKAARCGFPVYNVQEGKRYRIRLVSVTTDSMLAFAIQGHVFTVVAADGSYTEPVTFSTLDLHVSQTYSIVFTADQPAGNYYITTHIRDDDSSQGPKGAVILHYEGAPHPNPKATDKIPSNPTSASDLSSSLAQQRLIVQRAGYVETLPHPTREIIMRPSLGLINGTYGAFAINNYSYVDPDTPSLLQAYYGVSTVPSTRKFDKPALTWNYSQPQQNFGISLNVQRKSLQYSTQKGDVIQVVVQNMVTFQGESEPHPWHLHGHDFWVLGWGRGTYNRTTAKSWLNFKNPVKRNTAVVYPSTWMLLRFVADNPGFWLMHCHIVMHQYGGMVTGFLEAADSLPPLPRHYPVCGNITSRGSHGSHN